MSMRTWGTLLVFCGSLAVLVGCSGNGPGNFAHVSGTVTQGGAPVEKAKITFISTTEVGTSGAKEQFATETDSAGKYMLAGYGKVPGLPPGMYKVTITKLTMKAGAKLPAEGFDTLQLEMSGLGVNNLPKDYSDPNVTKLSATLNSGKNENVNFDLKK